MALLDVALLPSLPMACHGWMSSRNPETPSLPWALLFTITPAILLLQKPGYLSQDNIMLVIVAQSLMAQLVNHVKMLVAIIIVIYHADYNKSIFGHLWIIGMLA